MPLEITCAYPQLLSFPEIFWTYSLLKTVERIVSEQKMGTSDLRVFIDVRADQMKQITQLSGRKILICSEATPLCPDSQRVGVVFSRTWDQVFTWNKSFTSPMVRHFSFLEDEWKFKLGSARATLDKESLPGVFLYYQAEIPLCLETKKKLEKIVGISLKPICLSTMTNTSVNLIQNAQKVFHSNLAWQCGYDSPIRYLVKRGGGEYFQIGWQPWAISPIDSAEEIKRKIESTSSGFLENPELSAESFTDVLKLYLQLEATTTKPELFSSNGIPS